MTLMLNLVAQALPGVSVLTPQAVDKEFDFKPQLEWDWDNEHLDREREKAADKSVYGFGSFEVDRRVLKDVVLERTGVQVANIHFLSAGTFHKAYLVTLVDSREVVARVARRFMPRLKIESEVATLQYLRERTAIPVPTVYHYDSNPYNRLGGEYIIMSKAPGVPLAQFYHSMSHKDLTSLLSNLAKLVIPLFAHRFPKLGSIYFGPDNILPDSVESAASTATPRPDFRPGILQRNGSSFFSPPQTPRPRLPSPPKLGEFHVGPIVSWPFFGSGRGDVEDIDRGPWPTTHAYMQSCMQREIEGVIREGEGRAAPHRLHLDPDEIQSSRHSKHVEAVPGDRSDESDEWDRDESQDEWEGPGDKMYRDYRRTQRGTFLLAHLTRREDAVREEMHRWLQVMQKLGAGNEDDPNEMFGIDCHDLSLENIFVDPHEPSKITCIIDWESTTTRPLWACAHLPSFLQSSPFVAKLFREAVQDLAKTPTYIPKTNRGKEIQNYDLVTLSREWLHYEDMGIRLRVAHRCVEWDGWEEGLVDSILGPEELQQDWFTEVNDQVDGLESIATPPPQQDSYDSDDEVEVLAVSLRRKKPIMPFAKEKEREKLLTQTGDFCGGKGGELGRRLDALLTSHGNGDGIIDAEDRWRVTRDDDEDYDAEAE